jgi:hypothetical protein
LDKTIKLTLSEDEAEMIVDALEVDLEGYLNPPRKRVATTIVRTWKPSPKRVNASAS